MGAAARDRAYRERRRAGRRVFKFEGDLFAITAALIDRGMISERDALDNQKVDTALGEHCARSLGVKIPTTRRPDSAAHPATPRLKAGGAGGGKS